MKGARNNLSIAVCVLTALVCTTALADLLGIVTLDATTDEAAAAGLQTCRVFVQFDDPFDFLFSVRNVDIMTDDPTGFFQIPASMGGRDIAPDEADVMVFPELLYDSFVTFNLTIVPEGVDDCTALDDDFDSELFNDEGQVVGRWFCDDVFGGQADADADTLQVLIAQFTTSQGFNISGEARVSGIYSSSTFSFACDCNENGVLDSNEPDGDLDGIIDDCDNCPKDVNMGQQDCDDDGIGDVCTINDGLQEDCNNNGVPDNCELGCGEYPPPPECYFDCNANGVPDMCDLADGTSEDCNGNFWPDECDIEFGVGDCNGNSIPDDCDLGDGTSNDCNTNGTPDECEVGFDQDCNANGTPDLCDIFEGVADDCNENFIPDSCDVSEAGDSNDCNQNSTPDECEIFGLTPGGSFFCLLNCATDCNFDGVPDVCEIDAASSAPGGPFFCEADCDSDCNDNGVPDECDVAGVPDLGPTEPANTNAQSPAEPWEDFPVIASDGMGTWLATWRVTHDPYFARSTDNGSTWSAPMPLGTQDFNEQLDRSASIAFGNNTWIAVWRRTPSGDFLNWETLYSRSVNGIFWTEQAIIASYTAPGTGANGDPSFLTPVGTDGDGTWVAAWVAKDPEGGPFGTDIDIFFARSTDDGLTWSEPAALNTNATSDITSDLSVRLDTDRDGTWVAVWSGAVDLGEGEFEGAILFARSLDNGLTWSAPQPLTNPSGQEFVSHSGPTVAISGDTWVVVWSSTQDLGGVLGTDRDLLVVRSSDNGATWSDPQALNSTATDDSTRHDAAPDVSSSGSDWVVVWHSWTYAFDPVMGFDVDIFYARSSDDALSWSHVEPLGNSGIGQGNSDGNPRIASDGAGNWIAVWESRETLGNTIGNDSDILSVDFEFAGGDCNANGAVDECEIADGVLEDCTGNGVPDECEPDCNGNGQADSCDVADGISEDCNANEVPDECEPQADCNGNGVQDICDIAQGASDDCNNNGIPDECEPDCNGNDQADICDITDGSSEDCNTNYVPDECEPQSDCNENGVQDICDIAEGTSEDCNGNGVPDECEPADDDADGVPNECDNCDLFNPDQTDCQSNGVGDVCDLADGSSDDCNSNDVPDECEPQGDCNENGVQDICDIGEGTSADCDGNGVPDECQDTSVDCNDNGVWDACDVADGTSEDCNLNDIPDECEITIPIPQQPVSQEVGAGDFVFFTVQADGIFLEYQWRKDGVDLPDTERIFGTNTPGLIILEVVPADAGSYDCMIMDYFDCQVVSDPATLTVLSDCPADFDGDGMVGAFDLAFLLGAWGPCEGCPMDFDADGTVGAFDLAQLLGNWGPCQ